ncbi:hypothetical protein C6Y45_06055 [Alkalicoccus saliphilus]|uniref:Uncharacterized protein n=1 Tax=Alkalicoccus saliphilus TaxID=200989 RepID=A0A2T4U7L4_9BACI|nr:hypothetical protein C6Y45_06055 [Alkalicoccus saliphilus]
MEERAEFTRFLEKKPSFYFPAGAAAGDSRGEIGRAEDPFLPSVVRKKLAEAGPPGKRPVEAEAGRCLRLYKKHFINRRSLHKKALLILLIDSSC